MRILFSILLIAMLGSVSAVLRAEPNPPHDTVFQPKFTLTSGSFSAGTAFVCDFPEGKGQILITAQHLFGPSGGLETNIAWNEMAATVKQVDAASRHDPAMHVISTKVVPIEGAHGIDKTGLRDDLAVFTLDPSKSRVALKLATNSSKVSETVWLYGCQYGSKTVELIPAIVVLSNTRELDYSFGSSNVQLRATSGAPILNANGEVVAINIGSTTRRGKLIGLGNPLFSVRNHLEHAFAQK